MTAVKAKKYIVIEDQDMKASNAWFDECRAAEIPYIRVEHFGIEEGKSSVSWYLDNLPSELLKLFNSAQAELILCVRTIINLLLPDARIAEYGDSGGEVYFLEEEYAEGVAEVLGTLLFVLVDLAKLKLALAEVENKGFTF